MRIRKKQDGVICMPYIKILFASVFAVIFAGCATPEIGVMKFPQGEVQHAVLAKDIKWNPCPPGLPKECELMILEGHPKKADLFTVRFRLGTAFFMPSHTHPRDERVTILSGNVSVAFGEGAVHADATHFGPGDYYVNKRDTVHTVWIDSPAVIQITGIGPWEVHFTGKKP